MLRSTSMVDSRIEIIHTSYAWWGRLDLNQRPIGYEPTALTTELRPRS